MKRLKLLFTLAIPVLLIQNAQAQTSSRLTAKADWYNNGAIFVANDSTSYAYTNPRGGDLKHTLKYNTAMSWKVVAGDTVFSSDSTIYQQFDASNNIISKTRTFWNGTAWVNGTKTLFFYDASNNLDTAVDQIWGGTNWVNVSRNVYSYTSGNHLYSNQYQVWNSTTSAFVANSQKTYYYSVAGNLVQELDQNYSTVTSTYTYTNKFDYTYTATNQLASTTASVWNGSAWVSSYMYNYTYDTAGDLINTLYQTYNTTTAAWDNITLNTYSSFVSANPQMEIDQVWDTTGGGFWKNNLERTYSYNSFNQLTHSVAESWNVAGFWEHANGDPAANYYYETYTTTGVNNVVANGEVSIFPVPAQNMLNIKLNWNEAQAFTVTIIDMNGSVVRQWSVAPTAQYNTSVPVQNFATGNYVVKITGANSQIVKQIVVAH